MSTYYRQGQSDAYALASLDPPTIGDFVRRYHKRPWRGALDPRVVARVKAHYAEYRRGWFVAMRDARKVRGVGR